jgi:glutathione S-transferase
LGRVWYNVSSPAVSLPFSESRPQTLEELGVPYEGKEVSLTAKPQWFTELYQKAVGANEGSDGKVPILQDGDLLLAESAPLSQYLLDTYAAAHGNAPPASGFHAALTPEQRARSAIFLEQVRERRGVFCSQDALGSGVLERRGAHM